MKLIVTTADPSGGRADHMLDVPDGATVGDLGEALGADTLYLGERRLTREAPLAGSGVRDGSVLGAGAPVAEPSATRSWEPPDAEPVIAEIRHVGGPGAGRVWRLGPGSHEAGTDRGCALRLFGGDAPENGVWITVATDGTATFRLPKDADPDTCGLRSLTPPPPVDPETGTPLTAEEPAGRQDGGPGGHTDEPEPAGPDGLPKEPDLPPVSQLPPPSDDSTRWPAYADLSLGDHLLRLGTPFEPDAAVNPAPDGVGVEYNRPPRIAPHLDQESLTMPGPPGKQGPRPFPLLMMMMPLVMGLVMMSLFRSFYFVIFIFFTPVMAVGNWVIGRRTGRRQQADALRVFRFRRAALEREMRRSTVDEREVRGETFPDPAGILLTAVGPGHRLWQRRRRDPDWLTLRLGTVTRPSLKRIHDQARDTNHREVHWRLADVPFGVELADFGVVGVSGGSGTPRTVARWAVAQTAALHSPRDLRIVVLTTDAHAKDWDWVRWLPHLRPARTEAAVIALGSDPESTAHRVSELVGDVQARLAAAASPLGDALAREPDVLVVMDGARRLRDVPGVVQVLTQGPQVRIFSLCLDERERLLPEECDVVVTTSGSRLSVRASGVPSVTDVRADLVDTAWCEEVARALSPMRDVTLDSDSGLPDGVRLLPLLDLEPPEATRLLRAWARHPASTTFTLGSGYEGALRVDLVRDGPHVLIGGTTGSGKSELLQTMIGSLAAANRPDELAFVLVDYKGGSAFRECAELPHALGMITDLDGHLVRRALSSLDAELKRRERLLAQVGAKDHPEYRAKRARDPELAPLPRLLLVIDEFATLVRELPDFIPGLVSLAQRGRSLGIHLVLATQRPSGSVSNEIRANTNLRIALRVTDRSESQDIINAPDAAGISAHTPGRALLRRGAGAPTPFQTAWVGAERPGAEDGDADAEHTRTVRGTELSWGRLGRPPRDGEESEGEELFVAEERPTDLRALVDAAIEATGRLKDFEQQPSPWLPSLEDHLSLGELPPADEPSGDLPLVPYGLLDLPSSQERRLGTIDFATFGHLYVIGSPRSGRTQLLRTVAGSAANVLSSADLHLYGIDAAGGGLSALETLPHCGAVVSRHDAERLERLIGRLGAQLTARQRLIAQEGCANITEVRQRVPADRRPAHLLLMIDGWDALSGMLDDYDGGRLHDEVVRLLREGAAAGMHVIATSERLLLGGRLAAHNDRRLLLRQADPSDYNLAGMPRNQAPTHVPPGRGWHAPSGVETQVALLGAPGEGESAADVDQASALRAIGKAATERDRAVPTARRPFRVAALPGGVTFQSAMGGVPEARRKPLRALLGVGGDEAEPLLVDFAEGGGSFVVAGPPRTGRSTTLLAMSVSLLLSGTALIILTPRSSPLRGLAGHDLVNLLPDPDPSADAVTAALKEVRDRPAVVVVDDADLMLNCAADKVLREVASSGRDRGLGLLLSGLPESMSTLGWVGVARRARQGVLLGPKSIGEGDLIGVRLSAEQVRMALPVGRGWTAGDAGGAVAVQVPLTTLGD
ncbi:MULTISPECIES: FtsK/SpoIIIE domain-containing protein [unclassified Streptomyces]|uniref:FtsK/SpoIIIE domain-containing protein n=1 Tax=unclassified Streptomyces TaxID=2593676 RepID=UPI000DBAA50C|nr:FtsK/SpoIIIE domain-containing protein [Streptomyces sp. PsTaAH-137]MYT73807.1 hypothetical protein [Streptomyces sp. SID8367]RAJ89219.1 S-DNA-T family DNA segregation ATPase FtsK/SpoIIIE [Streptomyces sp. PsTaAH-137]